MDSDNDGKCIKGDCEDGYGIYVFTNGGRYEGTWKNGKLNGNGISVDESGVRYERWLERRKGAW